MVDGVSSDTWDILSNEAFTGEILVTPLPRAVNDEETDGDEDGIKHCAGCWSDFTEVVKDSDDYTYFVGLKADVETPAERTLDTFVPLKFTSQVVAGMNYTIVYDIGGDDLIEVKAFKNLSNVTTINSVKFYETETKDGKADQASALLASAYMMMTVGMVAFS